MAHFDDHRAPTTQAENAQFLPLFLAAEKEVFRYICALVPNVADAQDILQQTALALWTKFGEYDPKAPFVPWACRFALLETKSFLRRQGKWRSLLGGDLIDVLAARRETLAGTLERRFARLEGCLGKLPEPQRKLIAAYYFERQAVEQLAATNGRTVEAIYKALQRLRKGLLDCINASIQAEEVGA